MSSKKPKISLAWQMMIGLALGVVVGALVEQETAKTFLQPLGDLFIRLIRMVARNRTRPYFQGCRRRSSP